ncbi:MAG: diguanylate cyclase [Deltaproteobacteria bacterium]|nr:diguanylate cyclase [Deltaproteobacteria bacterium]
MMRNAEISKCRIIIADDDAVNGHLIEEVLRAEGHLTRLVSDGEAAVHMVRSWSPHLVLLDINMPKLSGLEALAKIRGLNAGDYVGVLLVTANTELEQVVAGLDAGADDYIAKPFRMEELKARVRASLRTKGLHDALRRSNKRLEEQANTDDLTLLYNMRFAGRRLQDEVEKAKLHRLPISCLMLDMDHFKTINDQTDHLFGSQVLREVGQLILAQLRTTDVAARYGGDEFFVLMPGTRIKDAVEIAEKIRKRIEAHVVKAGEHSVRVTASFGVAGTESGDVAGGLSAKELIRSADTSLYSAKSKGRNCTETFGIV